MYYVQRQLGHGSISITLDVYSHLFHGDDRHHVHRLDHPQLSMGKEAVADAESATQAQFRVVDRATVFVEDVGISKEPANGGVTEWPNVPVLKTGDGGTHPRVQISPPPPFFNKLRA